MILLRNCLVSALVGSALLAGGALAAEGPPPCQGNRNNWSSIKLTCWNGSYDRVVVWECKGALTATTRSPGSSGLATQRALPVKLSVSKSLFGTTETYRGDRFELVVKGSAKSAKSTLKDGKNADRADAQLSCSHE